MKRVLIAVGVIAALLVPSTATADVTRTDKQNAKKECKALQKAAGKKNFARLMHTSKRKAYGLCKKRKSREESRERGKARKNAARECREERGDTDASREAFRNKYGTNTNKRNAFGKCVSQHARANKEDMDDHDKNVINAARHCRTEHGSGLLNNSDWDELINKNKRNAFGKCVSWHARHADNNGDDNDHDHDDD
jgi:uncharacterized protein (DUF305 family)